MKTKRKITALVLMVAVIAAAAAIVGAPLGPLPRFSPGAARTPSAFNAIWTSIENSVNSISAAQLATGAVTETKILAGAVTQSKMNCSGYWSTLTGCGGSPGIADTLHRHNAEYVVFSDPEYAGTTVADALDELGSFVGYSTSAATDVVKPSYYLDFTSNSYAGLTAATAVVSVTASDTTGLSGMLFDVSVDVAAVGPSGGSHGYGAIGLYMQHDGATTTLKYPFIYYTADECTYRSPGFSKFDFNFSDYGFTAGSTGTIVVGFN